MKLSDEQRIAVESKEKQIATTPVIIKPNAKYKKTLT